MTSGPPVASLGRAAALIAVITVVARLIGLVRTAVFARAVGSDCVGTVYQTVNAIPNIVFDVVAGGMLAAAVVPLLAGPLAAGDRDRAARIASALLTWALVALGAVSLMVMAAAGPLSGLLLGDAGGGSCPGAQDLGRRMLVAFGPQILLYGVAIILGGLLQAGHRFAWPALAPLVSSVVVIAAYLTYGSLAGAGEPLGALSKSAELTLTLGTTAGVAALALALVPSVLRLRLGLRPTLRFPAGAGGVARAAVLAGAAALAGQQVCTGVMLRLANDSEARGLAVIITLAQTVFLLPWAILAVPVATSAFPRLSALAESGDSVALRVTLDRVLGVLATLCALGAAALFAAAEPIAGVLLDRSAPGHAALAPAIAIFAAGLLGWSLVALLGRALYAARQFRSAAVGQVAGWIVAIAAQIVLSAALPDAHRAAALAAGYAIGVTVSAALLLRSCVRLGLLTGGSPLMARAGRCAAAAIAGAGSGAIVGRLANDTGILLTVMLGVGAAAVAAAVALGVSSVGRDRTLGVAALRVRAQPSAAVDRPVR
ncbi:MAG: virulence factor family protein [Pseudonocardiales bacterium]|nr:virulence factor family protein [Pseudonocardiales bacterium]